MRHHLGGRLRLRGIDLYELRRQFARWDVGTWFEINDSFIGWQGKERPFVIVDEYDGGPLADARPRSASRRTSFAHAAHARGHEARCRIDRDGWIQTRVVASLDAEWLEAAYMCTEPDADTVTRLKALR
jgi:hypothetical protein